MVDINNLRNEFFSAQEVEKLMGDLLIEFSDRTSRRGLSISNADIDEIYEAHSKVQYIVNSTFERIIKQAEERQNNLIKYRDLKVISLGEDCLPRTLSTHWGIKPSAKLGEKSHPFDLAVHSIQSIVELIDRDFSGYLNSADLHFHDDIQIVRNKKLDITFNHEPGEDYKKNDFALLRSVYAKRVENFCTDVCKEGKILFVYHNENPEVTADSSQARLEEALSRKWSNKNYKLIVINTFSFSTEILAQVSNISSSSNTLTINACYPFDNYVWHIPGDCLSPAGYAFEKSIIDQITHYVDNWIQKC
jgi:hypothetical protein